ncbi:hypothetical protein [Duganella aceris]|uniref:DUF2946 domain-containing protein n=1 Tax=Duganella aceris TaxID=2703883 RepID=A0ABX0FG82_9BURK|nr:hypothetical protein [Duganella aceris]NGZ83534.1 hypothetical protein [Duganella aceris]
MLRSLIVWLMLLALPYQGYASATMLLCVAPAPAVGASMASSGPHDHAAMMAAQALADKGDHTAKSAHGTVKCGGTACCAAAAPLLAPTVGVSVAPLVSISIPFYADFLPAVDLAHPERPPQALHA